ncbi:EAL domain-containing protein, partial [Pseudomonas aeruginosa]|nr:EAL domain-containing protein [Pseudomonas aeruginosa]NPS90441.1 EAL domain-containing protein [Pseudomonas aeruginosa]
MSAFRPDGWTTPELAQAVERGQLELHYQPVVDLRSGGIVGAEAGVWGAMEPKTNVSPTNAF